MTPLRSQVILEEISLRMSRVNTPPVEPSISVHINFEGIHEPVVDENIEDTQQRD